MPSGLPTSIPNTNLRLPHSFSTLLPGWYLHDAHDAFLSLTSLGASHILGRLGPTLTSIALHHHHALQPLQSYWPVPESQMLSHTLCFNQVIYPLPRMSFPNISKFLFTPQIWDQVLTLCEASSYLPHQEQLMKQIIMVQCISFY